MARTKQSARKSNTEGKAPRKKLSEKAVISGKGKKNPHGPGLAKERKPHRYRPGTVALREIKRYQKSTDLLLRKLPFQRVVREIAQERKSDLRWQATALDVLQDAAESFLVEQFAAANAVTVFKGNVTITDKAMRLAMALNTSARKHVPEKAVAPYRNQQSENAEHVVEQILRGHSFVHTAPATYPTKASRSRKADTPRKRKIAEVSAAAEPEAKAAEPPALVAAAADAPEAKAAVAPEEPAEAKAAAAVEPAKKKHKSNKRKAAAAPASSQPEVTVVPAPEPAAGGSEFDQFAEEEEAGHNEASPPIAVN